MPKWEEFSKILLDSMIKKKTGSSGEIPSRSWDEQNPKIGMGGEWRPGRGSGGGLAASGGWRKGGKRAGFHGRGGGREEKVEVQAARRLASRAGVGEGTVRGEAEPRERTGAGSAEKQAARAPVKAKVPKASVRPTSDPWNMTPRRRTEERAKAPWDKVERREEDFMVCGLCKQKLNTFRAKRFGKS